jgi:hypothetical protein
MRCWVVHCQACGLAMSACRSCRICWARWLLESLQCCQQEARCVRCPAELAQHTVLACSVGSTHVHMGAKQPLTSAVTGSKLQHALAVVLTLYRCWLRHKRRLCRLVMGRGAGTARCVQELCFQRQLYGSWTRSHSWTKPAGGQQQQQQQLLLGPMPMSASRLLLYSSAAVLQAADTRSQVLAALCRQLIMCCMHEHVQAWV